MYLSDIPDFCENEKIYLEFSKWKRQKDVERQHDSAIDRAA